MFIAHVLQEDYFLSLVTENLGMGRATPRPATHIPCFCIKVARGLICRMIRITGGLKPSDTVIFSHTGEKQSTKKNWSIQNEYVDDFRGKDTMFHSSQLLFIFPRRAAVGSF